MVGGIWIVGLDLVQYGPDISLLPNMVVAPFFRYAVPGGGDGMS